MGVARGRSPVTLLGASAALLAAVSRALAVRAGRADHGFQIAGRKTPVVKPGKTATLVVTFTKTGRSPTPPPSQAMRPRG
jgi:hypothetical protein